MNDRKADIELADYFKIIWKRKVLIILCTFIAMVVVACINLLRPNIYRATASLVVLPPEYKTELMPPTFSVHTYKNLLKSPELVKGIIDTVQPNNMTVEGLTRRLNTDIIQEKYGTNRISYSPLILLHVDSNHPKRARDIANTWADLFIEKMRGLGFESKVGALAFITSQFEETENNLVESEEKLKDFQSKWRIELLEKEIEQKGKNLIVYESELDAVQLDIEATRNELAQMEEEIRTQTEFIILSKAITDDALWEKVTQESSYALGEDLNHLKLREETLNPIYQNLRQRIVNDRVNINRLRAKKESLEGMIRQGRKEIGQLQNTIVEKRLEQERLIRSVENLKKTYTVLAGKAESARLARTEESEDVKIATRAVTPGRKIGPNRKKNVITAGMVAFIVAVLLAIFLEYVKMDSSTPRPGRATI